MNAARTTAITARVTDTARNILAGLGGGFRRFGASRRGNVATMFAIVIIPLIGMVGAAVDYSSAYRSKERVQHALDAASLAVNRSIGTMSEDQLRTLARDTFAANMGSGMAADLTQIDIEVGEHLVTLTATSASKTMFMGLLGIDRLDISASSTTIAGQQTFEIAMVLDNSGSMAGSRIRDLREASRLLVDVLFAGQPTSDMVKVGIVPFAGAVNVGSQHRGAEWLDNDGLSPINGENLSENVSRFELFDRFRNAEWAGCVETRPYPYDVEDVAPSAADPATLFVPMFAPDEPNAENNGGYQTLNDYIDDNVDGAGRGRRAVDWDTALKNIDKYYDGVRALPRATGPNFLCDSPPITALTNQRRQLDSGIDALRARGMTNIHEGLMWGWRVLSPAQPFAEGLPYNERNNNKVIVLMTDGENTHRGLNSPNMSMYSAYGYASNGRLGPPTSNTSRLEGYMNARTLEACANAKRTGIVVYTIAFGVNDQATLRMLRDCASGADKAYTTATGSQLIATFENIAKELSALRIAR